MKKKVNEVQITKDIFIVITAFKTHCSITVQLRTNNANEKMIDGAFLNEQYETYYVKDYLAFNVQIDTDIKKDKDGWFVKQKHIFRSLISFAQSFKETIDSIGIESLVFDEETKDRLIKEIGIESYQKTYEEVHQPIAVFIVNNTN